MALEVIQAIKEAEARAEEIKKKAVADGRELIKDSDKQNESQYECKIVEIRQKAEEIKTAFENEALNEQQKMRADSERQIEELKAKAAANMDAAVQFILGRLD